MFMCDACAFIKSMKNNPPCRKAITKELNLEQLQQGMGLFFVTPAEANLRTQLMQQQWSLRLPIGWPESLTQRARKHEASLPSP